MARVASVAFAALPFAFGVIRAVKTGTDLRYLWVALAAGIAALLLASVASALQGRLLLGVFVFVASTAGGVVAAMLLGTKLGPGILVVAASFAACFSAACLLNVIGTPSTKGAPL